MGSNRPLSGKHVVLIARFFPPDGVIGARRAVRIARGLQRADATVTVVTTRGELAETIDQGWRDDALEGVRLLRTRTANPLALAKTVRRASTGTGSDVAGAGPVTAGGGYRGRLLRAAADGIRSLIRPDADVAWVPFAVAAALRAHRARPIDAVLTTLPSYSSFIAARIVGRLTGARVVVDYRDPWAADRDRLLQRTSWQWRLEEWMERSLLAGTDLALFTSPTAREFYRGRFEPRAQMEVLYNGIDAFVSAGADPPRDRLIWAHAGALYQGRSLSTVVRAMALLSREQAVQVITLGDPPTAELEVAKSLGVPNRIEYRGHKPISECLAVLRGAHRLVAIISPEHPFSIPGKLFDYLSVRRPILLLVEPDHAAVDVLSGEPAHRVVSPGDVQAIRSLLEEDLRALAAGGLPDVDTEQAERFRAEVQQQHLASWIASILTP